MTDVAAFHFTEDSAKAAEGIEASVARIKKVLNQPIGLQEGQFDDLDRKVKGVVESSMAALGRLQGKLKDVGTVGNSPHLTKIHNDNYAELGIQLSKLGGQVGLTRADTDKLVRDIQSEYLKYLQRQFQAAEKGTKKLPALHRDDLGSGTVARQSSANARERTAYAQGSAEATKTQRVTNLTLSRGQKVVEKTVAEYEATSKAAKRSRTAQEQGATADEEITRKKKAQAADQGRNSKGQFNAKPTNENVNGGAGNRDTAAAYANTAEGRRTRQREEAEARIRSEARFKRNAEEEKIYQEDLARRRAENAARPAPAPQRPIAEAGPLRHDPATAVEFLSPGARARLGTTLAQTARGAGDSFGGAQHPEVLKAFGIDPNSRITPGYKVPFAYKDEDLDTSYQYKDKKGKTQIDFRKRNIAEDDYNREIDTFRDLISDKRPVDAAQAAQFAEAAQQRETQRLAEVERAKAQAAEAEKAAAAKQTAAAHEAAAVVDNRKSTKASRKKDEAEAYQIDAARPLPVDPAHAKQLAELEARIARKQAADDARQIASDEHANHQKLEALQAQKARSTTPDPDLDRKIDHHEQVGKILQDQRLQALQQSAGLPALDETQLQAIRGLGPRQLFGLLPPAPLEEQPAPTDTRKSTAASRKRDEAAAYKIEAERVAEAEKAAAEQKAAAERESKAAQEAAAAVAERARIERERAEAAKAAASHAPTTATHSADALYEAGVSPDVARIQAAHNAGVIDKAQYEQDLERLARERDAKNHQNPSELKRYATGKYQSQEGFFADKQADGQFRLHNRHGDYDQLFPDIKQARAFAEQEVRNPDSAYRQSSLERTRGYIEDQLERYRDLPALATHAPVDGGAQAATAAAAAAEKAIADEAVRHQQAVQAADKEQERLLAEITAGLEAIAGHTKKGAEAAPAAAPVVQPAAPVQEPWVSGTHPQILRQEEAQRAADAHFDNTKFKFSKNADGTYTNDQTSHVISRNPETGLGKAKYLVDFEGAISKFVKLADAQQHVRSYLNDPSSPFRLSRITAAGARQFDEPTTTPAPAPTAAPAAVAAAQEATAQAAQQTATTTEKNAAAAQTASNEQQAADAQTTAAKRAAAIAAGKAELAARETAEATQREKDARLNKGVAFQRDPESPGSYINRTGFRIDKNQDTRRYEVQSPDGGVPRNFSSVAGAKAFAQGQIKDPESAFRQNRITAAGDEAVQLHRALRDAATAVTGQTEAVNKAVAAATGGGGGTVPPKPPRKPPAGSPEPEPEPEKKAAPKRARKATAPPPAPATEQLTPEQLRQHRVEAAARQAERTREADAAADAHLERARAAAEVAAAERAAKVPPRRVRGATDGVVGDVTAETAPPVRPQRVRGATDGQRQFQVDGHGATQEQYTQALIDAAAPNANTGKKPKQQPVTQPVTQPVAEDEDISRRVKTPKPGQGGGQPQGPSGPTGPTGPSGPSGPSHSGGVGGGAGAGAGAGGGAGAGSGGGAGRPPGGGGSQNHPPFVNADGFKLFDAQDNLRDLFREIGNGRYVEKATGKYVEDQNRQDGTGRFITNKADRYLAQRDDLIANGGVKATDSSISRLQRAIDLFDHNTVNGLATGVRQVGKNLFEDLRSGSQQFVQTDRRGGRVLDDPQAILNARQALAAKDAREAAKADRAANQERLRQSIDPTTGQYTSNYTDLGKGFLRDATGEYFQRVGKELRDLSNEPHGRKLAQDQEQVFQRKARTEQQNAADQARLRNAYNSGTGELGAAYRDLGRGFVRRLGIAQDDYFTVANGKLTPIHQATDPRKFSDALDQNQVYNDRARDAARKDADRARLQASVDPTTGQYTSQYTDLGKNFLRDATGEYFQRVGKELRELANEPHGRKLAQDQEQVFQRKARAQQQEEADKARLRNAYNSGTGELGSEFRDLGRGFVRRLGIAQDDYFTAANGKLTPINPRTDPRKFSDALDQNQIYNDRARENARKDAERARSAADRARLQASIDPVTAGYTSNYTDIGKNFLRDATGEYFQRVGKELRELANEPHGRKLAQDQEQVFQRAERKKRSEAADQARLRNAYNGGTGELGSEYRDLGRGFVRRLGIAQDEYFTAANGRLTPINPTSDPRKFAEALDQNKVYADRAREAARKEADRARLQASVDPSTGAYTSQYTDIGKNFLRDATGEYFQRVGKELRDLANEPHARKLAQDQDRLFQAKSAAEQRLIQAVNPAGGYTSAYTNIGKNFLRNATGEYFQVVGKELRELANEPHGRKQAQDQDRLFQSKSAAEQRLIQAVNPAGGYQANYTDLGKNFLRDAAGEYFQRIGKELRELANEPHGRKLAQDQEKVFEDKRRAKAQADAEKASLRNAYGPSGELDKSFRDLGNGFVRRFGIAQDEYFTARDGKLKPIDPVADPHTYARAVSQNDLENDRRIARQKAEQKEQDRQRLQQAFVSPGLLRPGLSDIGHSFFREDLEDGTRRFYQKIGDTLRDVTNDAGRQGLALRADAESRAHQSKTGAFVSGLTSGGIGGNGEVGIQGLLHSAGTTLKYTALYGTLGLVQQALSTLVTEMLNFEDSTTGLNLALEETGGASTEFLNDLGDVATIAGSNIGDVMDIASVGVRAFGDEVAASGGDVQQFGLTFAREAQKMALIANTTVKDAAGNIRASVSGFGLGPGSLARINDAVANAKRLGGTPEDISQGLASFAEGASSAGIGPELAADLVAKVTSASDRTGQAVGTSLTRIFTIAGGTAGQAALARANEQIKSRRASLGQADADVNPIDQSASTGEQIKQLAVAYDELSVPQQKLINNQIAGTNSAREFTATLKFLKGSLTENELQTDAAGASQEEYQLLLNNVAAKVKEFQGALSLLLVTLSQSGVLDPILVGFKALTLAIEAVTKLIEKFNDAIPRGARGTLFALGEIALAMKLINSLMATGALRSVISAGATRFATATGAQAAAAAAAAAAARGPGVAGLTGLAPVAARAEWNALRFANAGPPLPAPVVPRTAGLVLRTPISQLALRDAGIVAAGAASGAKSLVQGLATPMVGAIAALVAIGTVKATMDEFKRNIDEFNATNIDFVNAGKTVDDNPQRTRLEDLKAVVAKGESGAIAADKTNRGWRGVVTGFWSGRDEVNQTAVDNQRGQVAIAQAQIDELEKQKADAQSANSGLGQLSVFGDPKDLSLESLNAGVAQLKANGASAGEILQLVAVALGNIGDTDPNIPIDRLLVSQKAVGELAGLKDYLPAAPGTVVRAAPKTEGKNAPFVAPKPIPPVARYEERTTKPAPPEEPTKKPAPPVARYEEPATKPVPPVSRYEEPIPKTPAIYEEPLPKRSSGIYEEPITPRVGDGSIEAFRKPKQPPVVVERKIDTTILGQRAVGELAGAVDSFGDSTATTAATAAAKKWFEGGGSEFQRAPGEINNRENQKDSLNAIINDPAAVAKAQKALSDAIPKTTKNAKRELTVEERKKALDAGAASLLDSYHAQSVGKAASDVIPDADFTALVKGAMQKALLGNVTNAAEVGTKHPASKLIGLMSDIIEPQLQEQISGLLEGDQAGLIAAYDSSIKQAEEYLKNKVPDQDTSAYEIKLRKLKNARTDAIISDAEKTLQAQQSRATNQKDFAAIGNAFLQKNLVLAANEGSITSLIALMDKADDYQIAIARKTLTDKLAADKKIHLGNHDKAVAFALASGKYGDSIDSGEAIEFNKDVDAQTAILDAQSGLGPGAVEADEGAISQFDKAKKQANPSQTGKGEANYNPRFHQRETERRNALADSNNALDAAQRAFDDATVELGELQKKDDQYWVALKAQTDAMNGLAKARRDDALASAQLDIDLTNPVQVAATELADAKKELARVKGLASDPKNIGKGKLYATQEAADAAVHVAEGAVRTKQNSFDGDKQQAFLTDLQNADKYGRISHQTYLQGLDNEARRVKQKLAKMKNTDNGYKQLQDYLNSLTDAAKAAADQLSGQFNLGDIDVPSVYEVRTALKNRDKGSILGDNGANSTGGNVTTDNSQRNVILNGVPLQQVLAIVEDMFGKKAKTNVSRRYQ